MSVSVLQRDEVLPGAEEQARALLFAVAERLREQGMPRLEARGKLIRPVVALAGLGEAERPERFDLAVAAVQLAHEASLVHDDIIDGAAERRGKPSLVASRGVARALVHGDHLLTAAYRIAAETGSHAFARHFAFAVERTVAGEAKQASVAGCRIDAGTRRAIIVGKSGELFGCALAAAARLRDDPSAERIAECGRSLGVVYQMMDDLLDYLPGAVTGKPALTDYAQRHWTWPLDLLDVDDFEDDPTAIAARLHVRDVEGITPLTRALGRLDEEIEAVRTSVVECLGDGPIIERLLDGWRTAVRNAADRTSARRAAAPARKTAWPPMPSDPHSWISALAKGSRSFRFAARLFPSADRRRIAGVYSFCRYTDDLVDAAYDLDADTIERRLDDWVALAERAYAGQATGLGLLDAVMADASEARVPFRYVSDLVEGMRMDLHPRRYRDIADLRIYSYRVAGVVGQWLTELHGVRDQAVLERAATLGHAMQLTNILRDVGEDLDAGRLYLPQDLLEAHAIDRQALERMRETGRIESSYVALLEHLMTVADGWYDDAFVAIPALPAAFQRPVAAAAHIYRGIHDCIRRNGYDNLNRRAYTTTGAKVWLAGRALVDLRRARRRGVLGAGVRMPAEPAVPVHTEELSGAGYR